MNAVAAEAMIERAGRALIDAASAPARVILFGSHARGHADKAATSTSWSSSVRLTIASRRLSNSAAPFVVWGFP